MPDERVLLQQQMWQLMTPEQKAQLSGKGSKPNGSKAQQDKPKVKDNFELIGFVRCELGKSDREPFRQWQSERTDAELFDMLVKLCDSGYILKVGVGKEGHQASLSDLDAPTECNGYVLSAFASEARDCMALMLYKHHVLLEGDWSASLGGTGRSQLR